MDTPSRLLSRENTNMATENDESDGLRANPFDEAQMDSTGATSQSLKGLPGSAGASMLPAEVLPRRYGGEQLDSFLESNSGLRSGEGLQDSARASTSHAEGLPPQFAGGRLDSFPESDSGLQSGTPRKTRMFRDCSVKPLLSLTYSKLMVNGSKIGQWFNRLGQIIKNRCQASYAKVTRGLRPGSPLEAHQSTSPTSEETIVPQQPQRQARVLIQSTNPAEEQTATHPMRTEAGDNGRGQRDHGNLQGVSNPPVKPPASDRRHGSVDASGPRSPMLSNASNVEQNRRVELARDGQTRVLTWVQDLARPLFHPSPDQERALRDTVERSITYFDRQGSVPPPEDRSSQLRSSVSPERSSGLRRYTLPQDPMSLPVAFTDFNDITLHAPVINPANLVFSEDENEGLSSPEPTTANPPNGVHSEDENEALSSPEPTSIA